MVRRTSLAMIVEPPLVTPSSSSARSDPPPPMSASRRSSTVTRRSRHGPSNEKISTAGRSARQPSSTKTRPPSGFSTMGPPPTAGPNVATRRMPGVEARVARTCSGATTPTPRSRSLRTTTVPMPARRRKSARPGDPRPVARACESVSSISMLPPGASGITLRTAHGPVDRGCSGSSPVRPQAYVPNDVAGARSVVPLACSPIHSPVSSQ